MGGQVFGQASLGRLPVSIFNPLLRNSSHLPIEDDPALNTVLFGYFLLSRGFGNILSTPISSFLTNSKGLKDAFPVSGGKYDRMIIYVGTCFAGAAGVSLLGWGVQLRKRAVGAVQRTV